MATNEADRRTVRAYPFSPPQGLDLDPMYAHLLEHEPVSRVRYPYGEDSWLVTRWEDVRTVWSDRRFSRAAVLDRDEPRPSPFPSIRNIITMDPPEHTRLRQVVTKSFTPRRVEALRGYAERTADGLVEQMVDSGPPADLVDFGVQFPLTIICELLGVPYADRGDFGTWCEALLSATSLPVETLVQHYGNFYQYMATLVAARRQRPTDDLLGAMVQACDGPDPVSEQDIVELAMGLLTVGHETTATSLANFCYVLLTRPSQLEFLARHPEAMPTAVEELLRYVPLAAGAVLARYATEDVELSGVTIRAGEPVLAYAGSANRDRTIFDRPDELDLTRQTNPHLAFGYGLHHCLGASLARLELQVALDRLLRRLPRLRLAVAPDEVVWKKGVLVQGLAALPVSWDLPR